MIIVVDFDGTIVDDRFPDIGAPVPGAIYWLKRFKEVGFKLVLWTMRSNGQSNGDVLTHALNYCSRMGVEFDGVNHYPIKLDELLTSSPKAYAQVYIDDASFGCPLKDNPRCGGRPYVDWDIVGPAVLGSCGVATTSLESQSCLRPVRVVKPARIVVKQSRVAKTARKAPVRVKANHSSKVSKPKSKKRQ